MQGKKFKFSVVVPIYNIEDFLEEAIETIVGQTIGFEEHIQLILVNDGSLDQSGIICERYTKQYPDNIVYVKKENGGVSSARNEGMKHIQGEYVNFFDGNDSVCLILGDNVFHYDSLERVLEKAKEREIGATVFGHWVEDPTPFGVVELDEKGEPLAIEEKPSKPRSNYIIPGLYFYDNQVVEIAKSLKPSARGELEITDINREYLKQKQLQVIPFSKGLVWLDAGTADSLLEAAEAIKELQNSGQYVGCIEEIAWKKGFITKEQLGALAEKMSMTKYGQYLIGLTV